MLLEKPLVAYFIPYFLHLQPSNGASHVAVIWALLASSVLIAFAAYLLGSIPFGLVLTRLAGKGDIRAIGSGNIGATNVLRTGDKKLAALTLLLDMLKGGAAVLLAKAVGGPFLVAALFAVLGHMFPVWLRFKGGKGVATAIGVFLAIYPYLGLAVISVWLLVFYAKRISSLSALIAFLLSPLLAYFTLPRLGEIYTDTVSISVVGIIALAVILKHYANIRRLINHTEPKFGNG